MASKFGIISGFKWCVELPAEGCPRESPVFTVKGNECSFRLVLARSLPGSQTWFYDLYLDLKRKLADFKTCVGELHVGFKKENTFFDYRNAIAIREPGEILIWHIPKHGLKRNLLSDYAEVNWIQFLFFFEDTAKSHLSISEETKTEPAATTGQHAQESQKSRDSLINIHREALSRDLLKLLDGRSNSDVRITCEDQTFNAHRNILGVRSAVFSAMLESDMIEGETGLINVEDSSASIFQSFLRYLYSGTLPELNIETGKQCYEIADKYAIKELKQACSEFLTKNLSEENACEILVLADQHSDEDFRNDVISYIINEKIPEHDDCWPNFCKMYPIVAIEVLNLYIRQKRSK